jgi:hypothetical protein
VRRLDCAFNSEYNSTGAEERGRPRSSSIETTIFTVCDRGSFRNRKCLAQSSLRRPQRRHYNPQRKRGQARALHMHAKLVAEDGVKTPHAKHSGKKILRSEGEDRSRTEIFKCCLAFLTQAFCNCSALSFSFHELIVKSTNLCDKKTKLLAKISENARKYHLKQHCRVMQSSIFLRFLSLPRFKIATRATI